MNNVLNKKDGECTFFKQKCYAINGINAKRY